MVCRRQHHCAELTGIPYLLLSLLQLSSSRITSHTHTHTHTHTDLFHVRGAVLWGTRKRAVTAQMGNAMKDFKRNNVDGVDKQLTYVKATSLNRISPASTES